MSLLSRLREKHSAKFATATLATIATSRAENCGTVASVATVTVANSKKPKVDPLPSTPMSASEERAIRAWLTQIGETDEIVITETLRQCSIDEGERAFFLERAKDVPQLDTYQDDRRHCRECKNLTYSGLCLAARRGEIDEISTYHPADDLPRRCKGYSHKSNILSIVVPA